MASQRFPSTERLKSSLVLKQILKEGRQFSGTRMTLYVAAAPEGERRVGVVCRKTLFHKSVTRNRIKRRLRECYRLTKDRLKRGFYLLVVAKRPMSAEPAFDRVKEEFLDLCQKADLLKE